MRIYVSVVHALTTTPGLHSPKMKREDDAVDDQVEAVSDRFWKA